MGQHFWLPSIPTAGRESLSPVLPKRLLLKGFGPVQGKVSIAKVPLSMKHFRKQACIFKSARAPFVRERAPLPEAPRLESGALSSLGADSWASELAPSSVALLCRWTKGQQHNISKADPNSVQAHGWMLSFFPTHSFPDAPGCPGGSGAASDTAGDNLHSLALKMLTGHELQWCKMYFPLFLSLSLLPEVSCEPIAHMLEDHQLRSLLPIKKGKRVSS